MKYKVKAAVRHKGSKENFWLRTINVDALTRDDAKRAFLDRESQRFQIRGGIDVQPANKLTAEVEQFRCRLATLQRNGMRAVYDDEDPIYWPEEVDEALRLDSLIKLSIDPDAFIVTESQVYTRDDLPGDITECAHVGDCAAAVMDYLGEHPIIPSSWEAMRSFLEEHVGIEPGRTFNSLLETFIWLIAWDISEDGEFFFGI
jgi:hypothetical protein